MMGEIAKTRGDLDGALRRYREAMAGTAEMVRREPDNAQRLFDHAQNVFWVGEIADERGQQAQAEAAMREYKRLADQMVAIEPGNRKWQAEVKYAVTNLGTILFRQRKYEEAARLFERGATMVETLVAADPNNAEYRKSLPLSLAWLADAQFAEGRIDEAIAKRERQVALLEQMATRSSDVEYREDAVTARRALGRWLASRGSSAEGMDHMRRGVAISEQLMQTEPANMRWAEYAAATKLQLAALLVSDRKTVEAARETRAGCDLTERLVARDRKVVVWQGLAATCLLRRAEVARDLGSLDEASSLAQRALAATMEQKSADPIADRFAIAAAHKLSGDILSMRGFRAEAMKSWAAASAICPADVPANPREMAVRAAILAAVGRNAEAQALKKRLEAIGYRRLI